MVCMSVRHHKCVHVLTHACVCVCLFCSVCTLRIAIRKTNIICVAAIFCFPSFLFFHAVCNALSLFECARQRRVTSGFTFFSSSVCLCCGVSCANLCRVIQRDSHRPFSTTTQGVGLVVRRQRESPHKCSRLLVWLTWAQIGTHTHTRPS